MELTAQDKPADVVLVHGLWHGAWCWETVISELTDRGIQARAVELPLTTLDDDIAAARGVLDACEQPVVLVGHSYGGAVITGAGLHPRVRSLVYITAYQLDEGESVSRVLPGLNLPQTRLGEALCLDPERGEVTLDAQLGPRLLYSDTSTEDADRAFKRLRPVSRMLFRGVPNEIAWHTLPSTYVLCTADEVIDPALQSEMARRATRRLEWDSGHSPVLTRPTAVADLLAAEATSALRRL